ncbi:ATP synthase-coupling factor 6, mitochondrial-like [Mizuhopecten yessoensis]|uniref:ATP synthase-coupling factor 6, mitochondrial n=1 Tax=Mizuhopecten yessoensis TaxID=6573 RepID=A0A210QDT1_MIZYE|nr:ATP synthase-coupling factor 6, mitochondrial-like [Mizuhopecten yessoensis]XP_021360847.1 ATP synthase-coupling factor 6, mitochondrial-like [Mizuhopecten yessoensis]OWF46831.1 ATP synthase-coupling factor 6, mitochondrial [Mizuhopecten yessoensis]
MLVSRLATLGRAVQVQARRNFGVSAAVLQKADPIQKLFLDKIKEYKQKNMIKEAAADPGLQSELERVKGMYKVQKGEDMTTLSLPEFNDIVLGPVDLGVVSEGSAEQLES